MRCLPCTTNELKLGSRTEIRFHPYSLPFPAPEPSPLQHLPFRIPILHFSKESVHRLISKCIGEVIYDSHYYNRLAASKHVKIATIISPTFPSLAPHRRKSLINPVGVIHALVCFYNLWGCLTFSESDDVYRHLIHCRNTFPQSRYSFWESPVSRSFFLSLHSFIASVKHTWVLSRS